MLMSMCSVRETEPLDIFLNSPLDWCVSTGFNPLFPYIHNSVNFKRYVENNMPLCRAPIWNVFYPSTEFLSEQRTIIEICIVTFPGYKLN